MYGQHKGRSLGRAGKGFSELPDELREGSTLHIGNRMGQSEREPPCTTRNWKDWFDKTVGTPMRERQGRGSWARSEVKGISATMRFDCIH